MDNPETLLTFWYELKTKNNTEKQNDEQHGPHKEKPRGSNQVLANGTQFGSPHTTRFFLIFY